MSYSNNITPQEVAPILKQHILKDGYDMVMDLQKSQGVYVHDSKHGRNLLDFFSCFATIPLGYNHPKMTGDEAFKQDLLLAALGNPSNSDIYTTQYAHFLRTFGRVGIPDYLPRAFFIAGGSLAIENALKVAMDWKVQKNYQKGYLKETGHRVIHFREAFHGRSGYTLSLTNTDPSKTDFFAKFDNWPRVLNPKVVFPLTPESLKDLEKREQLALNQIKHVLRTQGDEVCALIVEPVQSEGGDNHFRPEFFKALRTLCSENDVMLIYDEVQTGVAISGKFWAHQHFGTDARPDMIAFGKKMQVCGILAGPRVDEVERNCFTVPSRINSTWGGNLVDMVRAAQILSIIEEDGLVEHSARTGQHLLTHTQALAEEFPALVRNPRGLGLLCAFDMPTAAMRNAFVQQGMQQGVMFLGCGPSSIRFRPSLTITEAEIDMGMEVARKVLAGL